MKNKNLLVVLCVFLLVITTLSTTNLLAQEEGQEHIVQQGDWLAKISQNFYGDASAWPKIVEATNTKAKEDSSFAIISNPNILRIGQKLWIPGVEDDQPISPPAAIEDLQRAYQEAVKDADVAEPDEICHNLTAIIASNSDLIWEGEPGKSRLLVTTWTSWDGYDTLVGDQTTLTRQVWVTVSPEVQTFCRDYATTHTDLTLRLEQLLGLPPDNGKTKFVEMWVETDNLFRPAPDPEITDHEAELEFPTSKYFTINQLYQTWFNELRQSSYGDEGYPWTRLGYTYDWGNPESEIGLSEFIVDTDAVVSIHAVVSTDHYCKP